MPTDRTQPWQSNTTLPCEQVNRSSAHKSVIWGLERELEVDVKLLTAQTATRDVGKAYRPNKHHASS